MSVKVFLPSKYVHDHQNCNLYGKIQVNKDNVVVYYIVDESEFKSYGQIDSTDCQLRLLGCINNDNITYQHVNNGQEKKMMYFKYNNNSPHIFLECVTPTTERFRQVKLILYDKSAIGNCLAKQERDPHEKQQMNDESDIHILFQLIQSQNHSSQGVHKKRWLIPILKFPNQLLQLIIDNSIIRSIMMSTTIYRHNKEWQAIYTNCFRLPNIILDRTLGLLLMFLFFKFILHPGDFLMQIFHQIITRLHSHLDILEGSPVGLKLNLHLNNFFLDCFKYHIELWSKFLDMIEPLVRQLFLAIAVLGSLGLTYQLALLADLISLIGLHSHCFYIYTKVLYNVKKKGLVVLWQVVRGKRFNILRERIENHNYMSRQLYLATIFFSAILFLFPTTLVYYAVFATLKVLTYSVTSILDYCRRQILILPIEMYIHKLKGTFVDIELLKLTDLSYYQYNYNNFCLSIFVYKINL